MHICILTSVQFPPREGIGNYVFGLSKQLIHKGHKVTIITRGNWTGTKKEVIEGIDVIKVRFIPLYPFYINLHGLFLNNIFKRIESNIDIVHVHTPLVPFIKTSLPLITTVHTPMLIDTRSIEVNNLRAKMVKVMGKYVSFPIELKLLKRSNMTTTVANSVAEELREYGTDPKKIIVIGNGVYENIFTPTENKTKEKYILFTGRLAYRKGLFDLINCGKLICEKYADVNFVIVGEGMLRDKLEKKVNRLNLENRIIFKGYVSKTDLINLYQNAILHVLPSHYEGLPTVILEAMSCGLPVVATAVSGNLDVIENFKNGLLVPPHSPIEMAKAISILLNDTNLRRDIGKAARKTIENKYTFDIISDMFVDSYNSLLIKD